MKFSACPRIIKYLLDIFVLKINKSEMISYHVTHLNLTMYVVEFLGFCYICTLQMKIFFRM